jgi:FKBP12-rapamycin complex-associated protein
MVLIGTPFRPLGAPPPRGPGSSIASVRLAGEEALMTVASSAQRDCSISLEDPRDIRFYRYVTTRVVFLISGHVLNEFVREAAVPYLEDDSPEVRKEAVLASTQLLVNDPICGQTSVHSVEIVSDVLGKLLTVGITDACEYSLARKSSTDFSSRDPSDSSRALGLQIRPSPLTS